MAKGYQVIEPALLRWVYGNPKHFEFAVAIYRWLIPLLYAELATELTQIEIDIIPICRFGMTSFPAIGIHYGETNSGDLEPIIESTIERLLKERPVIDLVEVIGSNKISWVEETKKIVGDPYDPKNDHRG